MKPVYPINPHPTKRRRVIDGKAYRLRRGEWVLIPEKWVGQTLHKQTKNKRQPVNRRTRRRKP